MKTSNRVGIRTCSDYSPFGVELDSRTVSNYGYRFGYQGSEKDDEVKGNGNSYTTEFRQLDPRLGKWLSVDPLSFKFPWQSTYTAFDNNPISLVDRLGSETEGGPGDGYTKNKDGSRSKTNANGTKTYDAPGFSSVNLPANAKVLGTMQDVDKKPEDGAIYHNNVKYEASVGDLAKFEIDNVEYTAQFLDGKFTGYESDKGQEYTNLSNTENSERALEKTNTIINTIAVTSDVKTELIDFASKAGKLSDGMSCYLKISKAIGVSGSIVTTGYSLSKVYDQYSSPGGLNNVLNHRDVLDAGVGMAGIGAFFFLSNPVGMGIGSFVLLYGGATMIYDAYEDKK